ncbi:MAG: hypothetical protein HC831_03540 [Chloroflexia bacterium]|nr:hypothetical protein [Chloroflexia bacterium]
MAQNGKKILYMNLASKTPDELKQKISEFKPIIAAQPKESILAITDKRWFLFAGYC